MGVYEKLGIVQKNLKSPKNQKNAFGGYMYRSCEDILEAAKPLCVEHGLVLTISDEVVTVGDRFYIKATATVTDTENSHVVSTTAFAREPLSKKGSDESQITGAASSYARKYALNGLFCIDDTKDADATNDHGKTDEQKNAEMVAKHDPKTMPGGDINAMREKFLQELKRTHIAMKSVLDVYSAKTIEDMTADNLQAALAILYAKPTYEAKK